MAQVNCIVVTPEKTAFEKSSDFVVVPLYDGELGIAPLHSPLIGRLGFGELRLRTGDSVERFYVDGGFVQVQGDTVTILTSRVVPARDLKEDAAHDQLRHALKRPAVTAEQQEIRERLSLQARSQLRVARRAR